MKHIAKCFLLAFASLLLLSQGAKAADIQRVEPPFWYVGMHNTELQLMIYGKDIASSQISFDAYEGVTLKEIRYVENPNYVFVYLNIGPAAKPGTVHFSFKEGRKTTRYDYELKARNNKPGAQGFSSDDVLYLIMPDRFANGDTSNDNLDGAVVSRPRGSRHGGDIKGITDHLGYLQDLGVTTVWLNPVQANIARTSHGYAIIDYYDIDCRLGTLDDYIEMVDATHARGMKVVMDMVINHCGVNHWWTKDIPTSDWYNFGNEFSACNHLKWTAIDPYAAPSEHRQFTDGWFEPGMPDLNQSNPLVATYIIQNTIWWIEYARIDGIRQDTHPYVNFEFGSKWCKAILDEYPDFNVTGETWYPVGSAFPAWWQKDSKLNPNGNSYLKTVMDFNFAFISKTAFTDTNNSSDGSSSGLFNVYVSMANDFLYENPDFVLRFLDNHDVDRFGKNVGGDINKFKQGIAFLLTTKGIPELYYGTELLMSAGNRDDFPGGWAEDKVNAFTAEGRTETENEAWNFVSKLLHYRQGSEAIRHGSLMQYAPVADHGHCYVYARTSGDETVLVILNGSDKDSNINMARYKDATGSYTKGVDVVTGKTVDITSSVEVPARGTYILKLAK